MSSKKPVHLFDRGDPRPDLRTPDPSVLVATLPAIEGRRALEHFGLVVGEAIIAPDMFRDFAASVTSLIGGRSAAYETPLREARGVAIAEAVAEAKERGANALIGVDLDYESIGGLLLVTVSGTAVRLEAASSTH